MRPSRADIAAPELPQRVRWLAGPSPRMAELTAAGPVLVHFFDFAQLNSVRALPYLLAWHERYARLGLAVLGVHSPRFPFTSQRAALAGALERLQIRHPVADDRDYDLWHDYGCKGWPSLFLWGQGGALRWFHFGEGEYRATEEAIQKELRAVDPLAALPELMQPPRPTDAPGALVAPPSAEVFPGGSASEPWEPTSEAPELELEYAAGGAFSSLDGQGELLVTLEGGEPRSISVQEPGLYELVSHPRHERHSLALRPSVGVRLWSVSFAAGLP